MNFKLNQTLLLLITFFGSLNFLVAQDNLNYSINWTEPIIFGLEGTAKENALHFENAQYNFEDSKLPFVFLTFKSQKISGVVLENVRTAPLTENEKEIVQNLEIGSDFTVEVKNSIVSKRNFTYVKINPVRKNAVGEIEKLISYEINPTIDNEKSQRVSKRLNFATQSKLSSGDWYKIAVVKEGVFKLSYNFLQGLGVDVDNIDPRNLKLYGYGGGMLPEANSEARPDDMQENAILVIGEADGSFDKNDYLLFYGEDQVEWNYDSTNNQMFRHRLNLYEDSTFYFIRTDGGAGKRISTLPVPSVVPSSQIVDYDEYGYYEKELSNLLKSGSLWIGELFDNTSALTIPFNITDVNISEPGKIDLSVLARSGVNSRFTLNVNGQQFSTSLGSVNLNRYEFRYAQVARSFFEFTPSSGPLTFNLSYNKPQSVSKGWLNSLTYNVRRKLVLNGSQFKFRDTRSVTDPSQGVSYGEFIVKSSSTPRIFDVTDKYNIQEVSVLSNGGNFSFVANTNELKEYIAFKSADSVNVFKKGKVNNQNLHSLPQADMLIVSHPRFLNAANELADFHRGENLSVHVVTPQQIYNEYSSGAQDLIAIRSFFKMFYDRANTLGNPPQYALMIGDASFDYKDRITGNTNLVPAYQSSNSIDPVNSYVSDDYFGLLDDSEGRWLLSGADRMDIGIGRFPVQTASEANGIVNKIKSYYSPSALGDWRNKIVFIGDDEDGVVHMSQSNDLSIIVENQGKDFNNQKIFLDAYQQQSTASGQRYPKVTEDINQAVERGALFMNYTGHGGETGWTAERVTGVYDITNWNNIQNMPIFMTATCEFSRFDDPLRTSGGELVLLNPNGGGIGLMTTTRLVFSSPNYLLNRTFYDQVFDRKPNGEVKRLGDIFLDVKNYNAYSANSRNFSLLGDPALRMALPKHNVVTKTINGKAANPDTLNAPFDTLTALSTVTITGEVQDINGNLLNSFNGIVYPTIYDKEETKKTLNNDGGGVFTYRTRERRIFKGKATVTNGQFSFSFVVPKDISYSYGTGKISYYAENQSEDANGYQDDFTIGGSNPSFVDDDQGPDMDLYMNDESFVYGGVTGNSPTLLVNLRDDQGINTVGSGIGHDLVAVLDEETDKAFILNDYYEASVDDYSKGKITFPFKDLAEGKHTLRVKAWDVANNSAEKTIEFNVVEDKELSIENLVNYPNPFTTRTEFIFQHNQAGVPIDVKLEIYTVSGKLVKSIDKMIVNEGYISRDITWDGRDDFGDKIAKGVYVYKLKIRSTNGSSSEKIEKLVIL